MTTSLFDSFYCEALVEAIGLVGTLAGVIILFQAGFLLLCSFMDGVKGFFYWIRRRSGSDHS